jgi:superfamily II DNA helicase RecQ
MPVLSYHASLQVLETKYRALLKMLLEERLLCMVCVDKVHLMVQFGLCFRAEFLRLKALLFSPLTIASSSDAVNNQNRATRLPTLTSVPILFMTATADHVMLHQLERITGYCFDQSNLFWPSAGDMQQRRQQLRYMPTTMVSSILCPLTKSCFAEGSRKKFIVYGNSRRQVEQSHASYRK